MSLRRRITLVSAAAVAVAVVLASTLTYLLTSDQLHSQIDHQLHNRAFPRTRANVLTLLTRQDGSTLRQALLRELHSRSSGPPVLPPVGLSTSDAPRTEGHPKAGPRVVEAFASPRPNQVRGYQQIIDSRGDVIFRTADVSLPVAPDTRALARSGGKEFFTDAQVKGTPVRILAQPLGDGYAIQYAQPLTDLNTLLAHLRLILALLSIGGVALAALLGRLIAGTAVAPIRRLTEATEHVTETRDLSRRIAGGGTDEVGRLAVSFNAMMDALERSVSALDASVRAQRQLIADASHELRTPVTSLRTNIEVLAQNEAMDPIERRRMLADVVEQTEELTRLMNDLIDLARGEQPRQAPEDLRLDLLVREAVERARLHSPSSEFQLNLQSTLIAGVPARLDRAINNLIDNAVKYGDPRRPVQISLRDGELVVQDHGAGIDPEDLPFIFDRFYRGARARGLPGSGLGLAIVKQVVDQHNGTVNALTDQQGTTITVRLPVLAADPIPAEGSAPSSLTP